MFDSFSSVNKQGDYSSLKHCYVNFGMRMAGDIMMLKII